MDPNATNEMQHIVDSLVALARRQGQQYKSSSSICITPLGAPALEYLVRKLDLAMLEIEPNVCLALGMAIIDIWEANPGHPSVAKSKGKVLGILSSRPALDPAIKMVRSDLRQAAKTPETLRASSQFLAGPGKNARLEAAQAHRLPLMRN